MGREVGLDLGKPTDGPVARYINRRVSRRITYLIVRRNIGITPNQLSLISFLLALLSSYLYLARLPAVAGVLVQLSSIVDGVDGELARIRGLQSRCGAFLDAVLDRYADIAIVVSAALYSTQLLGFWVLPVALLALAGNLLVSYVHLRGEHDLGVHPALVGRIPAVASRDVRLFIVFLASLAEPALPGSLGCSLVALAVLTHSYAALKVVQVLKMGG
ncbi:MAG: CDP-alcohol phosphatidyltransferase family protein [Desulfurococcaceae archaeon]|nr:CDP-alcohol phosphatidyltransferase family protein [Desulfurococcaceae archaeon]